MRRPVSRSETRVAYSPRASVRETRTKVSQTYINEAPRPKYAIEDRPRAQYLAGPPQHVGAGGIHIHQSAPISRGIPPPAPMPPPPPPVPKAHHHHPSPEQVIVNEKEKEVIVEKVVEKNVEKTVEEKVEKSPPRGAESKSRLEVVSVEHSDPRHSHSNVSRKHSRHGSRTSESARGSERRGDHDGVIVERERSIRTKRYLVEPARQSEPEYETYRYIEAPPVKKEVRYLEDNPRRSTGGLFKERERERERVVIDTGGSRRRRENPR